MSSAEPDSGPVATTPVDDRHQALLQDLTARLGAEAVVGSHQQRGDLWARIRPADWARAAEALRGMGFDYFCFLSGIDWMPHTWPNPKVSEGADSAGVVDTEDEDEGTEASPPEAEAGFESDERPEPGGAITTGVAGGDTRFQVLARLYSTVRHLGVTLKADLDDDDPHIATWTGVFSGADWCERETWEMYGFTFDGHPNLTHLYLPGEFEGFPLRKDFPLLAREVKPWPGLVDVEPMPDSAEEAASAQSGGDGEAG